jgi:hypothetical protein
LMPVSQAVRSAGQDHFSFCLSTPAWQTDPGYSLVKSTKTDSRVTFLLRLCAVILDSSAARCFRREVRHFSADL